MQIQKDKIKRMADLLLMIMVLNYYSLCDRNKTADIAKQLLKSTAVN